MENLSLCRICLATDVRLCSIPSHLRDIYEKITAMTFKREDRRPLVACYICQARLQYCYRLRTSCLQSEELLTEMLSSGVLKPQDVASTNTFRVVSVLNLTLSHAQQDITECHVKKEPPEFIWVDLEQPYTEDLTEAQAKQNALIDDNNQSSHLEASLDVIKEEAEDFDTDAEYINLEEGNIKIEEIDWEPDIAGTSSQSADNICPKIVKAGVGTRVSKKTKIAALKDTEDSTTKKRKIELIKNERTETITIKEPKILNKDLEGDELGPIGKILEICNKVDINLYKYNDKPYQCNICEKRFIQRGHLKTHILTHTGEKPYKCNICNKCFTYKSVLKTHIRTHTGEKPFQCNICKKSFVCKGDLSRHNLTHTGEKQYQCNVCYKYFGSKQVLNQHMRTHSGEKPYKCDICMKCFIQRGILKRHLTTHTGEKQHKCNICNKCFIGNGDLSRHIRTHTGEKPYQCNICEKSFSDSSSYTRHNRIHKR